MAEDEEKKPEDETPEADAPEEETPAEEEKPEEREDRVLSAEEIERVRDILSQGEPDAPLQEIIADLETVKEVILRFKAEAEEEEAPPEEEEPAAEDDDEETKRPVAAAIAALCAAADLGYLAADLITWRYSVEKAAARVAECTEIRAAVAKAQKLNPKLSIDADALIKAGRTKTEAQAALFAALEQQQSPEVAPHVSAETGLIKPAVAKAKEASASWAKQVDKINARVA
jgi:hypothetical protein